MKNLLPLIKERVEQMLRIDERLENRAKHVEKLRENNLHINRATINQKVSYVNK